MVIGTTSRPADHSSAPTPTSSGDHRADVVAAEQAVELARCENLAAGGHLKRAKTGRDAALAEWKTLAPTRGDLVERARFRTAFNVTDGSYRRARRDELASAERLADARRVLSTTCDDQH